MSVGGLDTVRASLRTLVGCAVASAVIPALHGATSALLLPLRDPASRDTWILGAVEADATTTQLAGLAVAISGALALRGLRALPDRVAVPLERSPAKGLPFRVPPEGDARPATWIATPAGLGALGRSALGAAWLAVALELVLYGSEALRSARVDAVHPLVLVAWTLSPFVTSAAAILPVLWARRLARGLGNRKVAPLAAALVALSAARCAVWVWYPLRVWVAALPDPSAVVQAWYRWVETPASVVIGAGTGLLLVWIERDLARLGEEAHDASLADSAWSAASAALARWATTIELGASAGALAIVLALIGSFGAGAALLGGLAALACAGLGIAQLSRYALVPPSTGAREGALLAIGAFAAAGVAEIHTVAQLALAAWSPAAIGAQLAAAALGLAGTLALLHSLGALARSLGDASLALRARRVLALLLVAVLVGVVPAGWVVRAMHDTRRVAQSAFAVVLVLAVLPGLALMTLMKVLAVARAASRAMAVQVDRR